MTKANVKPCFIGIGAQKCATTWIYDILKDHPEVCVSATKEVNFFSYHYDHGFQWYERQFEADGCARAKGEISPSYFYEPAVPERLANFAPEAKLLVSLRDPVDRAISNHMHEVRVGHLAGEDLSFEAGLVNNPSYTDQGLYATHLKRWLEYFPQERILILLFEEIRDNPEDVARRVYRFLDIDETHCSQALRSRSNAGHVNRLPGLDVVRRRLRITFAQARLAWGWEALARLGLRALYRRYNRLPAESRVPAVSAETRRVLRERFCSEVEELEQLIGRALPSWHLVAGEGAPAERKPPSLLKPILSG